MKEDFVGSNEVLNSWKEIAAYLNRGVRTVQRWEIELALPVRRPRGKSRSAVLALRSELDEWIRSCPLEKREAAAFGDFGPERSQHEYVPVSELISRSRALRDDLNLSRQGLEAALMSLMANVQKMSPPAAASVVAATVSSKFSD